MTSIPETSKIWQIFKSWRPYFIIAVFVFLLYFPTLFFGLTYLDDNTLILDRYEVLRDPKSIGIIFSTDAFFSGTNFYYRPLLNLSFMLDAQLGGNQMFFYHLDNILLHIISALLVFLLFKKIGIKKPLALFLTLIFAVHPAISQAVAWLPGRNDSLVAIFVLAAILSYLNYSARPRLKFLIAYAFFFFLAILTKETAIFLPLLLIIHFFTIGRRDHLARIDAYLALAASVASGFIWLVLRSLAFSKENIGLGAALWSVIENLPDAFIMAGKMILPFNLSVLPVSADSTFIFAIIAGILIILALFFSREKRQSLLIFGLGWFLIFFMPPFAISNGAPYFLEHRIYLPLIGFLIICGEIDFIKNLDWTNKKVRVGSLVFLLLLSVLTFNHSKFFKDPLTFWLSAVKTSPHSPLAQKNLGVIYYFSGQNKEAQEHYQEALKVNPEEVMCHNNLGVIYMENKQYDLAMSEFQAELRINPGYDKAVANYERLLILQKELK